MLCWDIVVVQVLDGCDVARQVQVDVGVWMCTCTCARNLSGPQRAAGAQPGASPGGGGGGYPGEATPCAE